MYFPVRLVPIPPAQNQLSENGAEQDSKLMLGGWIAWQRITTDAIRLVASRGEQEGNSQRYPSTRESMTKRGHPTWGDLSFLRA